LFSRKTVNWVTNDEYICSTKKANIQLGYMPDYAREDGIKNTLKWYKEKNLI
jgi:nucleoside-diphosphate-sugar epimerase